ncbi:hypothetical protein [Paenibacillus taiwanensis]|nr:hypothetical protein [Paenibacillus taiwanensis]
MRILGAMEELPVNKHLLAPTLTPIENKRAQMLVDLQRYVYAYFCL